MSSNSTSHNNLCVPGDTLCEIRVYEKDVIIVPTLLLIGFLLVLLYLCVMRCCPPACRCAAQTTAAQPHGQQQQQQQQQHYHRSTHRHTQRHSHRRELQGIDAPPELNALEHEVVPMTIQRSVVRPSVAAVPQVARERQYGTFNQVTPLSLSFSIKRDDTVSLYRARMDDTDVVLRILKESANHDERQHFLGFASFLSGLGPHPFLPALMGVVSVRSPLVTVMEELHHGELLGFLWRCRQQNSEPPCDLTERRIFTMAGQVASALEYLHSRSCIHGNVGARSVLVGRDLTAKLWGLGPAYRGRRRREAGSPGEVEAMELRKWQAPEVLARRDVSQSSDVWSFGILLYEMATLGEPPFAEIMASELLQSLQRQKNLRRPATCSNALFSVIRSCCQWSSQQRLSVAELVTKLQAGEKAANHTTVLRVAQPLDIEKYLREAGYGEAYNYAVL